VISWSQMGHLAEQANHGGTICVITDNHVPSHDSKSTGRVRACYVSGIALAHTRSKLSR